MSQSGNVLCHHGRVIACLECAGELLDEAAEALSTPVDPTPEPETCTSECNPYMSRCGAKFCTFEDMAAHEQECKRLVPSEETPR